MKINYKNILKSNNLSGVSWYFSVQSRMTLIKIIFFIGVWGALQCFNYIFTKINKLKIT